jgi:hypothetical protein
LGGRSAQKSGQESSNDCSVETINCSAWTQRCIAKGQGERQGHNGSGQSTEEIAFQIAAVEAMNEAH